MVGLGHPQQVRDDQQRKGLTVRRGEFTAFVGDEFVDQLIGEAPHELLVLLESLWSEEAVEQGAVHRVPGRVERHQVLAHREPVAADLNLLGDVITGDLERQRKGPQG